MLIQKVVEISESLRLYRIVSPVISLTCHSVEATFLSRDTKCTRQQFTSVSCCSHSIYLANHLTETGTFRFSHKSEKPLFSTSNFMRSLKLADFSGLTVTRNTSFAGSSDVSSFAFTPD